MQKTLKRVLQAAFGMVSPLHQRYTHGLFRILNIHEIPDPRKFDRLLGHLVRHYEVITPRQAEQLISEGGSAVPTATGRFLVSFDDGFRCHAEVAGEILSRHGIKALFFICPGLMELPVQAQAAAVVRNVFHLADGHQLPEALLPMSWKDAASLSNAGHTIGSHTMSHRRAIEMSIPELMRELEESAELIRDRLRVAIDWFAFPIGGSDDFDRQSLELAHRQYRYCCSDVAGDNFASHASQLLLRMGVDLESDFSYQKAVLAGASDVWTRHEARALLATMSRDLPAVAVPTGDVGGMAIPDPESGGAIVDGEVHSEGAPTVSVLMNCYNGERYLREAIDSVYAQTYRDWEIVLWDDASTDGTAAIARSYDGKLRYFKGIKARGLGEARNHAVRRARGRYLAFLDQDDVWLPEKLERQIPLFDDPKVGLVYSDAIMFNHAGVEKRMYAGATPHEGYCFPQLFSDYFLGIETVVVRRSALDGLDVWFEPNFSLCEESDLFTRISLDWKLAMVASPLAKWRVHSDSWTWKLNDRAADESEAVLLKYLRSIPDLNKKCPGEIESFRRKIAVARARNEWKVGRGDAARVSLAPFASSHPKALVLYVLTYLPHAQVFPFVARLLSRIVPD